MTNYRHWALCNIKAFLFSKHLNGLANTVRFSRRLHWKYTAANSFCDHTAAQYEIRKQHPLTPRLPYFVKLKRRQFASIDGTPRRLMAAPWGKVFPPCSSSPTPIHFTVRFSWDLITFCVKYKLIYFCNTCNDQEISDLKILCSSNRLRH